MYPYTMYCTIILLVGMVGVYDGMERPVLLLWYQKILPSMLFIESESYPEYLLTSYIDIYILTLN